MNGFKNFVFGANGILRVIAFKNTQHRFGNVWIEGIGCGSGVVSFP